MIAEVELPLENAEVDGREYDDESGEAGGFGSGGAKVVTQHILSRWGGEQSEVCRRIPSCWREGGERRRVRLQVRNIR